LILNGLWVRKLLKYQLPFFTIDEFLAKYPEYDQQTDLKGWQIETVSEMIFSLIGLRLRDASWTSTNVPLPIKNASMEQYRFMLDHDIPFVDTQELSAGNMSAKIKSDYSSLTMRILGNYGYLYRGNPLQQNWGLDLPFGGN